MSSPLGGVAPLLGLLGFSLLPIPTPGNSAAVVGTMPTGPAVAIPGGGGKIPDSPMFGMRVSDGSLLQLKSERDLGTDLPRNKHVSLTYTMPTELSVVRIDPFTVLQSDTLGRLDVSAATFDYGPLSLRPTTSKYAYTLHVPDGVHDLDVTTHAKWESTPAESPYRVFGGHNSAPSGIWNAPTDGASVRIGTAFAVAFVLADADGDDVTYELYAAGTRITYGTAAPGSTVSMDYTPGVGSTSFSAVLTDSLGATTTIAGPTVTAIDNRSPLGGIDTASQWVREGSYLAVIFHISDPEDGPVSWEILEGSTVIASGNDISVAATIKFLWLFPLGEHLLSLRLSDSYGWISPITGPTIKVVAWEDVNVA